MGASSFDPGHMALQACGGLALFLHGLALLGRELEALAADRAQQMLKRFTGNRWGAIATGFAATALLGSSSVTIIMVIALTNAGLLSLPQAIGLILGSNIGTTMTSQVFAFDLDRYAAAILAAGVLFQMAGRGRLRALGSAIVPVGMVFFGLHILGDAAAPLKEHPAFLKAIREAENPWKGALVGAVATALIQASSATVGVAITLASQGMMTVPAGIAIMLGAEVGTCSDTLIAALGRSRATLRAGLFHLLFNIATAVVALSLAPWFIALVTAAPGGTHPARAIANGHLLFNTMGVLLVAGFVPWIARGLEWLVPESGTRPQSTAHHHGLAAPDPALSAANDK